MELKVELLIRLLLDARGWSMGCDGGDLRILEIERSPVVIYFKRRARVVDLRIAKSLEVGLDELL